MNENPRLSEIVTIQFMFLLQGTWGIWIYKFTWTVISLILLFRKNMSRVGVEMVVSPFLSLNGTNVASLLLSVSLLSSSSMLGVVFLLISVDWLPISFFFYFCQIELTFSLYSILLLRRHRKRTFLSWSIILELLMADEKIILWSYDSQSLISNFLLLSWSLALWHFGTC